MIKIALFGATGKTGQAFIETIKNNSNYQIKALIRKNNFKENFNNIKFIFGNILEKEDVLKTIQGADCVISVIGHNKKSPKNLQTDAVKNIISVMNDLNIKKLISLTGTGVRMPNDKISLIDKFLNLSIQKIDPDRIKDGIEHTKIISQSNLDYTIIRVLKLTNQNKIQDYKLTDGGPAKILISRKTVAKIILNLIESNVWNRKMPVVSNF